MDSFFKVIIDVLKESKVAIWICILIIVFALIIFLSLCLLSIYKIYQKIDADNKVLEIVSDNAKLNKEQIFLNSQNSFREKQIKKLYERTNIVEMDITRIFSKSSSSISEEIEDEDLTPKEEKDIYSSTGEVGRLLSDYIDFLTHELSFNNRVRIILWGIEDDEPVFHYGVPLESFRELDIIEIFRSSNYSSRNKEKKININKSIAGRAMRKNKEQFVDNVQSDPDWSNEDKSQYISIWAVPLSNNQVLTIDYENKPDDTELYLAAISAKLLLLLLTLIKNNILIYQNNEYAKSYFHEFENGDDEDSHNENWLETNLFDFDDDDLNQHIEDDN